VKKKHCNFIVENNNNNRKHIKIKNRKDKSFKKNLKHEPNIVGVTHLCIRHGVQTSKDYNGETKAHFGWSPGSKFLGTNLDSLEAKLNP
jgi:hypothetical protein